MNTLDRDIEPGEEVIVKEKSLKPEYRHDLFDRVFVCQSGFGLSPRTMGGKIYGYYKKQGDNDAGRDCIRGEQIDQNATLFYQLGKKNAEVTK